MGRKSKGERRQVMTRVPPTAGEALRSEVESLGCTYSDFIAFVLCQSAGVLAERPAGDLTNHPAPRQAPGGRLEFSSRVPVRVADLIADESAKFGCTIADYVAQVLCRRYGVEFEPRVKKKALRAWAAHENESGELLLATG